MCGGQAVLPVGQADLPRRCTVSLYCPRCSDVYHPRSGRHANVDGAYFGTTFPHLFLMTYPQVRACPRTLAGTDWRSDATPRCCLAGAYLTQISCSTYPAPPSAVRSGALRRVVRPARVWLPHPARAHPRGAHHSRGGHASCVGGPRGGRRGSRSRQQRRRPRPRYTAGSGGCGRQHRLSAVAGGVVPACRGCAQGCAAAGGAGLAPRSRQRASQRQQGAPQRRRSWGRGRGHGRRQSCRGHCPHGRCRWRPRPQEKSGSRARCRRRRI